MICKKRTIFTLLVIIVLYLSSSLTCFAAGDGNIDNGGGSMGQVTATDIWHHEDGVRVTVVALDGTIVSVPFDLTNFDIEDNIYLEGIQKGAPVTLEVSIDFDDYCMMEVDYYESKK